MVRLSRKLDPSQTGIEAEKLHSDLRKLVVGQEEAVNQIVNIYQTFRSGMTSPPRNRTTLAASLHWLACAPLCQSHLPVHRVPPRCPPRALRRRRGGSRAE